MPDDQPLSELNPFKPPKTVDEQPPPSFKAHIAQDHTWWSRLSIWILVCTTSAAPSFIWGYSLVATSQVVAMCVGISIFVFMYTLVDVLTAQHAWRKHFATRRTLMIGYISRMVISVVFPIGGVLDLFCGLFSIGIVESIVPAQVIGGGAIVGGSTNFGGVLLITLVQGLVLNLVLGAYMLAVWGVIMLILRYRPARNTDQSSTRSKASNSNDRGLA